MTTPVSELWKKDPLGLIAMVIVTFILSFVITLRILSF